MLAQLNAKLHIKQMKMFETTTTFFNIVLTHRTFVVAQTETDLANRITLSVTVRWAVWCIFLCNSKLYTFYPGPVTGTLEYFVKSSFNWFCNATTATTTRTTNFNSFSLEFLLISQCQTFVRVFLLKFLFLNKMIQIVFAYWINRLWKLTLGICFCHPCAEIDDHIWFGCKDRPLIVV